MSQKSFEERKEEVTEQMEEEGLSKGDAYAEDIFKNGLDALNLSGKRRGGEIVLPNERLAILWRKVFRVQFTDGGWRDTTENRQMEHPFSYADARVEVDTSRSVPLFKGFETHEKMKSPLDHFDPVPQFYGDMIYLIRMYTGDDSYGMTELKNDLQVFEKMEFDVAPKENCSRCNPDIY
jgi:hypothetical protein